MFLKPVLPVLDYAVNYEYISKVLCVNKDKPMMHCNGKCHLMKELAKAADPDASGEKPISPIKKSTVQEQEVLFFQEIKSSEINQTYSQNNVAIGDHYSNLYFQQASFFIFHPPTFV